MFLRFYPFIYLPRTERRLSIGLCLLDKERPYGAAVERYNFTFSTTKGIRCLMPGDPGWPGQRLDVFLFPDTRQQTALPNE